MLFYKHFNFIGLFKYHVITVENYQMQNFQTEYNFDKIWTRRIPMSGENFIIKILHQLNVIRSESFMQMRSTENIYFCKNGIM